MREAEEKARQKKRAALKKEEERAPLEAMLPAPLKRIAPKAKGTGIAEPSARMPPGTFKGGGSKGALFNVSLCVPAEAGQPISSLRPPGLAWK